VKEKFIRNEKIEETVKEPRPSTSSDYICVNTEQEEDAPIQN
jgi:hypothetical protein